MGHSELSRLPILKSPLAKKGQHRDHPVEGAADLTTADQSLFQNPQFEHYEATSNLQLFYDLFFVANLGSFTSVHEINSRESLASYIGFICILWFTWCQVTLYDVRFATDSIFERIAHACHFGVMVGLAVIGPNFLASNDGWGPLQQLSLILMVSRAVLFFQYGATLCFTWSYQKTRTPLIAVMASLAVAVFIYLGISFAFYNRTSYLTYIVWYFIAVAEVTINVVVASVWPALSLWKTHLVERMTCLTLIILGEGIIGLTHTIVKIQKFDGGFNSADIGMLIAAVLVIYFTYQLYFDNVSLEALSARRQHISCILHFPFHLALCLMMEGVNQTLLWAHIVGDVNDVFAPWDTTLFADVPAPLHTLKEVLNDMITDVFSRFPTTEEVFGEIQNVLNEVEELPPHTDAADFTAVTLPAFTESMKTIIEGFGWETPAETHGEGLEGLLNAYTAVIKVFNITFAYFCICTGVVFVLISVFSLLSSKHDTAHPALRYLSTSVNVAVGLTIALLSILTRSDKAEEIGESPWVLPVLMLIMLALLILNHLPRGYYKPVVLEEHV